MNLSFMRRGQSIRNQAKRKLRISSLSLEGKFVTAQAARSQNLEVRRKAPATRYEVLMLWQKTDQFVLAVYSRPFWILTHEFCLPESFQKINLCLEDLEAIKKDILTGDRPAMKGFCLCGGFFSYGFCF
jgi:hypothetical protein